MPTLELIAEIQFLKEQLVVATEALRILSELGGGRSDGNSIAKTALTKLEENGLITNKVATEAK